MTYVLIPGAGCTSWHWHPVTDELRRRGRDVVAVDLPCEDPSAGLTEYVDAVVDAVGTRTDLVVVAHSLGGFTAPLVCDRLPVRLLVLVAGMIPAPGETFRNWWANTRYVDESTEPDPFFHDLPPELAGEAERQLRNQSGGAEDEPWPAPAWPDVPTRFVLGRDDQFFSADFLRRVARERLELEPDEVPGGHFPMLGHPVEVANRLEAYRAAVRAF